MAFPLEILKTGIGIADNLTKGVQTDVTLERWTGQDGYGKVTYASPITVKAVVDTTRKQRPTSSGKLVTVIATITIVGDLEPYGAAGRREPVDPRDRITLADGTTGPVLDSPMAVLDPTTSRGLIQEIQLGEL